MNFLVVPLYNDKANCWECECALDPEAVGVTKENLQRCLRIQERPLRRDGAAGERGVAGRLGPDAAGAERRSAERTLRLGPAAETRCSLGHTAGGGGSECVWTDPR